MTSRDLKSNVDASQSLAPAERTASANGTGIDTRNHDSAMVVFNIGLYTDGGWTPAVEESDDNSIFTAVAAADLEGAFTAINDASADNTTQRVGYKGNKRFIRAVLTEAGASPAPSTGLVAGATISRGHPHGTPTA